jgi:hypothetical protein
MRNTLPGKSLAFLATKTLAASRDDRHESSGLGRGRQRLKDERLLFVFEGSDPRVQLGNQISRLVVDLRQRRL